VFSCPNPSCKKTFTAPLKTLNLQEDPDQPYNACPYCLTKLAQPTLRQNETPKAQVSTTSILNENLVKEKPTACQYHLGYLGERTQNQPIPEDCLICKDIVECMLRNMRKTN
jgi:hypothetical protein